MKRSLASKNERVQLFGEGVLLAHHCFDLVEVAPLLVETAKEMGAAVRAGGLLDLGERVVLPAPNFWFEWGTGKGLLFAGFNRDGRDGALVHLLFDELWDPTRLGLDQYVCLGGIVDHSDGRFQVVRPPKELGNNDVAAKYFNLMFYALAAIALINSPAAERMAVESHRGMSRDIRAKHPKLRETRASVIVLRGAREGDGQPATVRSPKAYHFCRAHTRAKGGRVERVRSHWRGDPAFGIRIGRYHLKPEDQA